jgi:hypothetical protein
MIEQLQGLASIQRSRTHDKYGVVRHKATPRPHFRGEEIRPSNHAPVRAQECLPGGRTLGLRRHAGRLQDPGNCRTAHAILGRSSTPLDSRVAPGWILCRHPHRQAPNLRQHSTTTHATSRVRPLPGDERSMPAKQCVRSHDGRDLPQPFTAQPIRSHGESTSIVIGQLQASTPAAGGEEHDPLRADNEACFAPGGPVTR